MPYCHHCNLEQKVGRFCLECGQALQASPPQEAALYTEQRGDTGVDRSSRQVQKVDVHVAAPAGSPEASLTWDYCPIDGRYVRIDRTFRCRECGRAHLCQEHLDPELRVCAECAAEIRGRQHAAEEQARRMPTWRQIGIDMVRIPEGAFLYGEDKVRVHMPEYYLARTPVTNAQYRAFVEAKGHQAPDHWQDGEIPSGKEGHPVVEVSWHDATAFCEWAGCRLPRDQEWEKGARGTDGREYPWGDEWELGRCNSREAGIGDTTPVGRYPNGASPYGLLDMAGNVLEWCEDWYDSDRDSKVLRGGSWGYGSRDVRSASRNWGDPVYRFSHWGFRCSVSPTSSP